MDVTVGIISYDEDISILINQILDQKLEDINISEIISVSNMIFPGVKTIIEKKRMGKYYAVNRFLEKASSEILVLCSGDIRLKKDTIERICSPLKDGNIGIVASRPVPRLHDRGFLSFTNSLVWHLHHKMSMRDPKFGEVIAFRNIGFKIPQTSVDEEMISRVIVAEGYEKYYEPRAVIYNRPPQTISGYVKQRQRIYNGHLFLKKNYNYSPVTLNNLEILKEIFVNRIYISPLNLIFSILLESYARSIGYFHYLRGKEDIVWEVME